MHTVKDAICPDICDHARVRVAWSAVVGLLGRHSWWRKISKGRPAVNFLNRSNATLSSVICFQACSHVVQPRNATMHWQALTPCHGCNAGICVPHSVVHSTCYFVPLSVAIRVLMHVPISHHINRCLVSASEYERTSEKSPDAKASSVSQACQTATQPLTHVVGHLQHKMAPASGGLGPPGSSACCVQQMHVILDFDMIDPIAAA